MRARLSRGKEARAKRESRQNKDFDGMPGRKVGGDSNRVVAGMGEVGEMPCEVSEMVERVACIHVVKAGLSLMVLEG